MTRGGRGAGVFARPGWSGTATLRNVITATRQVRITVIRDRTAAILGTQVTRHTDASTGHIRGILAIRTTHRLTADLTIGIAVQPVAEYRSGWVGDSLTLITKIEVSGFTKERLPNGRGAFLFMRIVRSVSLITVMSLECH